MDSFGCKMRQVVEEISMCTRFLFGHRLATFQAILLLATGACAQDELATEREYGASPALECRFSLVFQQHEIDLVIDQVERITTNPKSYLAAKGLFSGGFYYVLILIFDSTATVVTYDTVRGIDVQPMPHDRATELHAKAGQILKTHPTSLGQAPVGHRWCDFIQVSTESGSVEGSYMNVDRKAGGDSPGSMLGDIFDVLNEGLSHRQYDPGKVPLPPNYDKSEIERLEAKIEESTFGELDDVLSQP